MVELAFCSFSEQFGGRPEDGFRMLELPAQYLVSGTHGMAPGTIAQIPGGYACWLTPGRYLAVTITPPEGFVSEITHGSVVFAITAHADDLVAMGCSLPAVAIDEGRCAQTLFAGLRALLVRHEGTLQIHVERSLAPHLRDWLRQAATSFPRLAPPAAPSRQG